MSYFTPVGADTTMAHSISMPSKTTEPGYTGAKDDNGIDWGSALQSGLKYLTSRQERERAKYEAQAAQRAGMGPVRPPGQQAAWIIGGGVALLAVVMLLKK